MSIRFMSIGSGSSGNSYFLGTNNYGILIDAGLPVRTIKRALKDAGIGLEEIYAVFVTHDHADHIKSVGALGEKYNIPIYATHKVHEGIKRNYSVTQSLDTSARYINKEEDVIIRDMVIRPFEVPHDATDNVGYSIDIEGKNFAFLTDIGEITDTAAHYINKSNYLILESNYDEEMLMTGRYPDYLKRRVSSNIGHLSNAEAAEFLANNFRKELEHVWLCHISKDNNIPYVAIKTMEEALANKGIILGRDIYIEVLERKTPSRLYRIVTT